MIKNKDSLKAKAANLAKKYNVPNKYIIQRYMFEALIERISKSKYKDNFIIKGGFLFSAIFGVDLRSTMDLDTTIKGLPLEKSIIENIIKEIININITDNITFEIERIKEIRLEDKYNGFNVNIKADFEGLMTNLLIDVTTGDIITHREVEFKYKTLFDNEIINIMTYNFETIIAEKFETIISRNVDNTRLKDYYDLYMFVNFKWDEVDKKLLREAIINTSKKRESLNNIQNAEKYVDMIKNDKRLNFLWNNYQKNYDYAKNITYEKIVSAIEIVSKTLKQ